MNVPENLKYSRDHEWVRVDGDFAVIGITDYAQDQLGEIVFVELPGDGEEFPKGEGLGVVESVKSVSDIFAPISCEVIESNDPLADSPETINEDPYGEGWLVKVRVSNPSELGDLLGAEEYEAYIREESE